MQAQKNGHTILVGEDELEVRAYLEMALEYLGYSVELAQDSDEIIAVLSSPQPHISAVLVDIPAPHRDCMDVLQQIRRFDPGLPVIIISGSASTLDVVTAMKSGAADFLTKPVEHEDLRNALARALEGRSAAEPAQAAPVPPPARLLPPANSRRFVGTNPRVKEIHSLIGKVGWSEAPVLIQGETGSGKEVLARELHAILPGPASPFSS